MVTFGEFADRRGLANAVHANEEPDGHATGIGPGRRRTLRREGVAENSPQRRDDPVRRALRSQFFEHRTRRRDPDVTSKEDFFNKFKLIGAELTSPRDRAHSIEDASRRSESIVQSELVRD